MTVVPTTRDPADADEQVAAALERSAQASCATVRAAPAETCLTTCDVPPVAEKFVVPAGHVMPPDVVAGTVIVHVPLVLPESTKAPVVRPTPPSVNVALAAASLARIALVV